MVSISCVSAASLDMRDAPLRGVVACGRGAGGECGIYIYIYRDGAVGRVVTCAGLSQPSAVRTAEGAPVETVYDAQSQVLRERERVRERESERE